MKYSRDNSFGYDKGFKHTHQIKNDFYILAGAVYNDYIRYRNSKTFSLYCWTSIACSRKTKKLFVHCASIL